jgi:activator of 2-hydroxyglutaryl-CoA dehydratase
MTRSSSTPPVIDHPLNVIVATDCGSTTTKAILIEKVGDEYRQTYRGEAPTTVEAPFEDVTRGVLNAIAIRSSRPAGMHAPAWTSTSRPAAPAAGCK